MPELAKALLSHILQNEALTRGLTDPEARMLVEWLVEQAQRFADSAEAGDGTLNEIKRLCHRGRAIGRFVGLWCYERDWGGAGQLAATERFAWPMPATMMDPCELMQTILSCEASAN